MVSPVLGIASESPLRSSSVPLCCGDLCRLLFSGSNALSCPPMSVQVLFCSRRDSLPQVSMPYPRYLFTPLFGSLRKDDTGFVAGFSLVLSGFLVSIFHPLINIEAVHSGRICFPVSPTLSPFPGATFLPKRDK